LQEIAWHGRRDFNPPPPSNINNLTPKTVWTYRKSVDKFNRYYSLFGNGDDSTERRDMEEIEGWESHSTEPIIQKLMQTMFLLRLFDSEELMSANHTEIDVVSGALADTRIPKLINNSTYIYHK